MSQLRIPAVYMRGGTSKGVFFLEEDLPSDPGRARRAADAGDRQPRPLRQAHRRHGRRHLEHQQDRDPVEVRPARTATSTTCSARSSIDQPVVDWSGNCGNLSTAVGPFAISTGLVDAPADGTATVRIWQANIRKTDRRPRADDRTAQVQELGDFELDGVAFPAAEVQLEFLDPADDEGEARRGGAMFPTGNRIDELDVPGVGTIEATMINAGNPDDLRRCRAARPHRHRAAGATSTATPRCWRWPRRCARTARCAWAW